MASIKEDEPVNGYIIVEVSAFFRKSVSVVRLCSVILYLFLLGLSLFAIKNANSTLEPIYVLALNLLWLMILNFYLYLNDRYDLYPIYKQNLLADVLDIFLIVCNLDWMYYFTEEREKVQWDKHHILFSVIWNALFVDLAFKITRFTYLCFYTKKAFAKIHKISKYVLSTYDKTNPTDSQCNQNNPNNEVQPDSDLIKLINNKVRAKESKKEVELPETGSQASKSVNPTKSNSKIATETPNIPEDHSYSRSTPEKIEEKDAKEKSNADSKDKDAKSVEAERNPSQEIRLSNIVKEQIERMQLNVVGNEPQNEGSKEKQTEDKAMKMEEKIQVKTDENTGVDKEKNVKMEENKLKSSPTKVDVKDIDDEVIESKLNVSMTRSEKEAEIENKKDKDSKEKNKEECQNIKNKSADENNVENFENFEILKSNRWIEPQDMVTGQSYKFLVTRFFKDDEPEIHRSFHKSYVMKSSQSIKERKFELNIWSYYIRFMCLMLAVILLAQRWIQVRFHSFEFEYITYLHTRGLLFCLSSSILALLMVYYMNIDLNEKAPLGTPLLIWDVMQTINILGILYLVFYYERIGAPLAIVGSYNVTTMALVSFTIFKLVHMVVFTTEEINDFKCYLTGKYPRHITHSIGSKTGSKNSGKEPKLEFYKKSSNPIINYFDRNLDDCARTREFTGNAQKLDKAQVVSTDSNVVRSAKKVVSAPVELTKDIKSKEEATSNPFLDPKPKRRVHLDLDKLQKFLNDNTDDFFPAIVNSAFEKVGISLEDAKPYRTFRFTFTNDVEIALSKENFNNLIKEFATTPPDTVDGGKISCLKRNKSSTLLDLTDDGMQEIQLDSSDEFEEGTECVEDVDVEFQTKRRHSTSVSPLSKRQRQFKERVFEPSPDNFIPIVQFHDGSEEIFHANVQESLPNGEVENLYKNCNGHAEYINCNGNPDDIQFEQERN